MKNYKIVDCEGDAELDVPARSPGEAALWLVGQLAQQGGHGQFSLDVYDSDNCRKRYRVSLYIDEETPGIAFPIVGRS